MKYFVTGSRPQGSSLIGQVNTIEVSHCLTLFSYHSDLCHCSWFSSFLIVILHRHTVNVPQMHWGDCGYHTLFIPQYSAVKLSEILQAKIMYN